MLGPFNLQEVWVVGKVPGVVAGTRDEDAYFWPVTVYPLEEAARAFCSAVNELILQEAMPVDERQFKYVCRCCTITERK